MNQIILASHSKLASGMAETVRFFGGGEVIVLEQTMTDSGFAQQVSDVLEQHKDQNIIVFTDLYGGSVNQCFFRHLKDYSFHLVTGMNLAVILECLFTQTEIDDAFIRNAVAASKQQFVYMNDVLREAMDDDDD